MKRLWAGLGIAIISTLTACAGESPTAPQELASVTHPRPYQAMAAQALNAGQELSISDGFTTLKIDENGEISITDGNDTYFLEFDPELHAQIAETIISVAQGDANYDALGGIDPWGPGGMEPMALPSNPSLQAGYKRDAVLFRKASLTGPRAQYTSPGITPQFYGTPTDCVSIAQAIALSRMQYHVNRSSGFSLTRSLPFAGMASIIAGRLVVPYAWAAAALGQIVVSFVEGQVSNIQMGSLSATYADYSCNNPIHVQLPFQSSGLVIFSGTSSNTECYQTTEDWEISVDGGRTWQPIQIKVTRCFPKQS